MIPENTQRPFSWLTREERLTRPKDLIFSKNIRGICPLCGFKTQKPERGVEIISPEGIKVPVVVLSPEGISTGIVQKQAKLCPRCIKKNHKSFFLVFPEELIPWKTNPNLTLDRAFECIECRGYRFSDRILGSLCSHKNHSRNVCRFCCRKISKKAFEKKKLSQTEIEIHSQELNALYGNITRHYNPLQTATIHPRHVLQALDGIFTTHQMPQEPTTTQWVWGQTVAREATIADFDINIANPVNAIPENPAVNPIGELGQDTLWRFTDTDFIDDIDLDDEGPF